MQFANKMHSKIILNIGSIEFFLLQLKLLNNKQEMQYAALYDCWQTALNAFLTAIYG